MALKEKDKDKKVLLSEKQLKKIDKKIEDIEDIYFGELALSRKNEPTISMQKMRAKLGI